jgi:hypothetical protein
MWLGGSQDRQPLFAAAAAESNSMRATSRMCDVSINMVTKLLVDVGTACDIYLNETCVIFPASGFNATKFGPSAMPKRWIGHSIRTAQELLGHKQVESTIIYILVARPLWADSGP